MYRTRASLALLGLLWAVPTVAQTRTPTPAPTPAAAPTPTPAPAATPRPAPAKLDYDSLAFGRLAHGWVLAGEVDSLWAHSDSAFRVALGSKDRWAAMQMELAGRAGVEVSVVEERWIKRNNTRQYWRVFNASDFTEQPLVIRWALLPGKMIAGLGMNPLSNAPPADPN